MSSSMVGEAPAHRPHPAAPVGVLSAAVDGLAGRPVDGLTDTELADTVVGVRAQIDRLEALSAGLLAAVDRRGMPAQDGEGSTASWYATRAQLHRRQAAAQVACARTLADELPRLRQAAVDGAVCWAKVRTAASHAARVDGELFGEAEPVLLGAATELSTAQFEALCKALRARAEALLDADPDREAFHRRYLQVSPVGELVRIDGQLDRADGQTLLAALDALMNPATTPTTPKHGETGGDGQDLRTARARRADALVWLAGHALNTADLPQAGGHRPHLNVLVDLPTLQAEATRLLGPHAGDPTDKGDQDELSPADAYQARVEQATRLLPQIAAALAQQIRTNRHPGGAWTEHRGGPLPPNRPAPARLRRHPAPDRHRRHRPTPRRRRRTPGRARPAARRGRRPRPRLRAPRLRPAPRLVRGPPPHPPPPRRTHPGVQPRPGLRPPPPLAAQDRPHPHPPTRRHLAHHQLHPRAASLAADRPPTRAAAR